MTDKYTEQARELAGKFYRPDNLLFDQLAHCAEYALRQCAADALRWVVSEAVAHNHFDVDWARDRIAEIERGDA